MIKGTVTGDAEIVRALSQGADTLPRRMGVTVAKLTMKLAARVKSQKLTGQVLNVRTGRLRRSITPRVTGMGSSRVEGVVGTNVSYARKHEYGFTGTASVRAHLRMVKKAFGKSISPTQVQVRAHSRNVVYPEKSFLRSALKDMKPEILQALSSAVLEDFK